MELLSIVLTSLSALAVILAILFEGRMKAKNNNNKSKNEKSTLTRNGWILIIISIIIGFGNTITTCTNIRVNNEKYTEDTTKKSILLKSSYNINKQLREKSISDSIRITHLEKLTRDLGLKSDSIKLSVVDNAIKALDEQRQAIERERENVFIHFQKEVKDNLSTILYEYEEKNIRDLEDTTMFVIIRLSDIYIKKYELVSNKKIIIEALMKASEKINQSNFYADELLSMEDLKYRKLGINSFLDINEEIYNRLSSIYARISDLKSYKEYETMDFSKKGPIIDRQQLKESLFFEVAFPVYDEKTKKELLKGLNIK